MLICSCSFAQSTTYLIDYTGWTVPGGIANIFSSPTTFEGWVNTSVYGAPHFDDTTTHINVYSVVLPCGPYVNNGPSEEVAYVSAYDIKFSFKQYYKYAISLYANGGTNNTLDPRVGLLLSQSEFASDGASSPQAVELSTVNTYVFRALPASSGGPAWFNNIIDSQLTKNYSYLVIMGAPDPTNGANDYYGVYIRKVQIIETPPFSLTPASENVSCGTESTETFTVGNNNGITGITGYTWNIGANSGWLYNGSAAPATINTSTNTLTLTSSGATTAPSSITATVAFQGTTFTTNASVPNYVAPTAPAIVGPAAVCTSGSYSIGSVLSSGTTVTWTDPAPANGNGTFTLTPGSNNTATLTFLNYFQSTVTLTATYSGGCLPASTLAVYGTSPAVSSIEFPGLINQAPCFIGEQTVNQTLYYGSEPNFLWDYCPTVVSFTNSVPMTYTVVSGSPSQFSGSGTTSFQLTLDDAPVTINMYRFAGGGCPSVNMLFMPYDNSQGPNAIKADADTSRYTLAPSPARTTVFISARTVSRVPNKLPTIQTVKIFDLAGHLRTQGTYGSGTTDVQLDVSRLETGVYFAQIFDGKAVEVKKFFVMH